MIGVRRREDGCGKLRQKMLVRTGYGGGPSDWEICEQRLFQKRICDLGLRIKGSPLEPFIRQLEQELSAKGVDYVPAFYLTDSWGCPDKVPAIGIPFYLACPLLGRIEKEQTGSLEDNQTVMQLLRHETGHAINYAFRLWEEPSWRDHLRSVLQALSGCLSPESVEPEIRSAHL